MNTVCKNCHAGFEIAEEDFAFYEKVSPVFNGKKYQIPPPQLCPECRQQRRLASLNEMHLYPGECFLCKKRTLTQYPPAAKQPVLCVPCWHSDWDVQSFGRDFDFSRPFFEQFRELLRSTPLQALHIDGTNTNSDFMHYAGSSKNCYLIAHADFCEDCYYGYGFKENISCVDGFYNLHCELCYDCVDVHKCYGLIGSQDCISCSSSAFLRDCVGCKNCFLCVGLRNKEFCFENEQLTQTEYKKRVAEIDTGSYSQYQSSKKRLRELELEHPFKAFHGTNLENCLGDYLYHCKNTQYCFDCEEVESAKFCSQLVLGSKDVYDIYQYGTRLQQSYDSAISGADSYGILFCSNAAMASSNLIYCYNTEAARNCFGCASIHNQQYCILNKQYSREEYEKLANRIIEHMTKAGEWGEYFPVNFSLFGYNKTTAQWYYPLTREQATAKGYPWDDYETPRPNVSRVLHAEDLPDNINNANDDILNEAIECETTGKLFKITKQELDFYHSQCLPLPRRHPETRHFDRFAKRNPRKFWSRACAKCAFPIKTTYAPDRPEKVYCEECYLAEVY